MWFGLTVPEWVDVGVAAATLALAGVTAWMAWKVRDQADQTRRLAEVAERQLEATTVPVVRIVRIDQPDHADIVTVNEGASDERLVVSFENRGPAPASIEQSTMTPGGTGRLAKAGVPTNPVLEPNGGWDVDFDPSYDDKRRHAEGNEVIVEVVYEAIGSGARYSRRSVVKRDPGGTERWRLLHEDPPTRL